jgi:hypothetical protein
MVNKPERRSWQLSVRLLVRRWLATWLCLLRHCADGRGSIRPGAKREAALRHNQVLQSELRRFYTPYHRFCQECGSQCCREPAIPFSRLDALLYEGLEVVPRGGAGGGQGKSRLSWNCFRTDYLHLKLRQFSWSKAVPAAGEQAAGLCCPALTAGGCGLAWGSRPAICVFCACPRFLEAMAWRDFGRYLGVTTKYLGHLTWCLAATRT